MFEDLEARDQLVRTVELVRGRSYQAIRPQGRWDLPDGPSRDVDTAGVDSMPAQPFDEHADRAPDVKHRGGVQSRHDGGGESAEVVEPFPVIPGVGDAGLVVRGSVVVLVIELGRHIDQAGVVAVARHRSIA